MKQLLIVLVAVAVGCGGEGPSSSTDGPAYVMRDSAGIQIVENHRPTWSESESWRLSEEPLFMIHGSDGSEGNILLDPTSIDVDSRGRIIIADGNQVGWDAILVYDSLGQLQFRAGGQGQGPGEFGQLWWASSYRGDSIVGFDMSGDKLSVFGPSGRFARLVRMPALQGPRPAQGTYGYTAGMDGAYGDGFILAYPFGTLNIEAGPGPAWYEHSLLRLRPDGESWDTLGTFQISQAYWDGTRQHQYWFGGISSKAVGESELYYGPGDTFEVRRYDRDGQLTRVIRRTHEPRPVTEQLKGELLEWYLDRVRSSPEASEEVLERVRNSFDEAGFSETLPPYSHIMLDEDGNVWVEEFRWFGLVERPPNPAATQWSVFDPSGIWLGNVETPPGFILRRVTSGRALGFVVDEFDVKEVVVYALNRPGT